MFCLWGILPTFVIEAFVNFLEWYELACRSKEFTEESLRQMDEYMKGYVLESSFVYIFRIFN